MGFFPIVLISSTYLAGNVEDRSTSAMYYEDLGTDIEPNESEDD
jgi:hypothetical protein